MTWYDMPNCHPKINRKKYAIWCEECTAVFDDLSLAEEHQEKEKHRMKKTEYVVMETVYF
jgi:hypothetical protein